ncbi:MAG: cell division protein FtsL [Brevibacillus sp.]|nr:cell division protein FtsL [Brevibacillus sp.]
MAYYYRGNLAVDVDKSRSSVIKKKKTVIVRPAIPTGEKLLYLFMIMLLVTGAGFVGLRYIQISEYNYQIQKAKSDMASLRKENDALLHKIEQMSSRERIMREAEQMGMTHRREAVRIIGSSISASSEQTGQ